ARFKRIHSGLLAETSLLSISGHADNQEALPVLSPSPRARGVRTSWTRTGRGTGDHPRVRGEQRTALSTGISSSGPSPRARGAAHPPGQRTRGPGTIPACAGSSRGAARTPRTGRDHPRVRGEQNARYYAENTEKGPSPRARGAVPVSAPARLREGTIPACAGS